MGASFLRERFSVASSAVSRDLQGLWTKRGSARRAAQLAGGKEARIFGGETDQASRKEDSRTCDSELTTLLHTLRPQIVFVGAMVVNNTIRRKFKNSRRQRRNKLPIMADKKQRPRIVFKSQV